VVYADENFENINDILTRYDTLMRISKDLETSIERNEKEIETIKRDLAVIVKVFKWFPIRNQTGKTK
jgi:hypothetical protein